MREKSETKKNYKICFNGIFPKLHSFIVSKVDMRMRVRRIWNWKKNAIKRRRKTKTKSRNNGCVISSPSSSYKYNINSIASITFISIPTFLRRHSWSTLGDQVSFQLLIDLAKSPAVGWCYFLQQTGCLSRLEDPSAVLLTLSCG